MNLWKNHLYQPEAVSEWLNKATIVIDTNVLLAAYQWRKITVNEVLQVLEDIKKEDRLRIPLQVIKEFSVNRPKQIKQRMNDVDQIISRLQADVKPIKERLPMLQNKEDSAYIVETLRENYNLALKQYKDELLSLRDEIKKLFIEDLFLDKLLKIGDGAVVSSDKKLDELLQEASKRFKDKVPPGYKDSSKESNSSGDFLIWSTILEIDNDVVFVSGDIKEDWVYSDKNGESIVARRELSQEFFNKNGKRFAHITPRELINLMKPSISDTVREDLERYETSEGQSFYTKFHNICSKLYELIVHICELKSISYFNNELDSAAQQLFRYRIISEEMMNEINSIAEWERNIHLHDEEDFKLYYFLAKSIYDDLFHTIYIPMV